MFAVCNSCQSGCCQTELSSFYLLLNLKSEINYPLFAPFMVEYCQETQLMASLIQRFIGMLQTWDPIPAGALAGGHSLKMGDEYVLPWRMSLHALLVICKTPFQHFSVLKILLSPQNHKFVEILSTKASNLAESPVLKPPQIGPKFNSLGYILLRNSVH